MERILGGIRLRSPKRDDAVLSADGFQYDMAEREADCQREKKTAGRVEGHGCETTANGTELNRSAG